MSDSAPAIKQEIREAVEAENSLTRMARDLTNAALVIREAAAWENDRVSRERNKAALIEEMDKLRAKADKEKAALAEETRKAAAKCEDAQKRLVEVEAKAQKTEAAAKEKAAALIASAEQQAREVSAKARSEHASFKAQAEAELNAMNAASAKARAEMLDAQKAKEEFLAEFSKLKRQAAQLAGA